MRVALITRSTLFSAPGGDTVQVLQTAAQLQKLGVQTEVKLSNEHIDYKEFDLLHFFNIARPADIMHHQKASGKPSVVSTILIDYSEYDRHYRKGLSGMIFNHFPVDGIEYIKSIARFVLGKDHLSSIDYLWKGQRRSIRQVMDRAAVILPNSNSEYRRITARYGATPQVQVVTNGINPDLFHADDSTKDNQLVICVARIEGIKNQLNLIRALNNTRFRLLLIGTHAPNQAGYYQTCQDEAAANISFIGHLPQNELIDYYRRAKVHVLPSWFETTGLSTLEATAMGCNVVITDKGDTRDYFGDNAFYCNPASPQSILEAIEQAATSTHNPALQQKIITQHTWQQAARQTLLAYQTVVS